MTSIASSLKFQAVCWLVIIAVSAVRADVKQCPDGKILGEDDENCVGEPQLPQRMKPSGRRLLRGPHSPKRRDLSTAPNLANRRSLLAAMCSDTDNSVDAVISCTNAVRIDPTAFDFPCGYAWASQYPKATNLFKNSGLSTAALRHSQDQASRGTLSHTGGDGSSVGDRASRAGYTWNGISENIAFGYTSAKSVVYGWVCSPGHRRNIMSCDTMHIGVGIANGQGGRPYHTQVFGCPRGTTCSCSGGQSDTSASSPSYGGGSEPTSVPTSSRPAATVSPKPYRSTRPAATASPKPYRSTGPYFFSGDEGTPITFFGYGPQDDRTKRSPYPSPTPSPSPKGSAIYTQTYYPSATANAKSTGSGTATATATTGNNANTKDVFSTGSNVGGAGSKDDESFFGGFNWEDFTG